MDTVTYIRFAASLVLVLGMILGGLWLARRFGVAGLAARASGRRRLGVVEVLALDNRRRLVLVRRDGAEHLLLVGGTADLVVEAGIVPDFTAAITTAIARSGTPAATEESA